MKRLALLASLSVSALAVSATGSMADYTLNILHLNDWHSRIESINKYESTCSAEDETENKCFGGAARLKTAIDQRRAAHEGENILLLNAGDNFQGSLFYTTYKGAVEAEFLNLMKFDAMAVGNHEFDDGEDGLAGFLNRVSFPVLSANVLAGHKSSLKDRIEPYVVLEVGDQKIAIIGAVANDTDELSAPGENVLIAEDVAAIASAVEEVVAQGVNKVVALTHVGYPRDLAVIAAIPNVDVVVGGHSHTVLSNTDPDATGPYPTMVDNPGGYKVPVVQAGSYSKYLGELAVVFDDSGVVTSAVGEPVLLDSSIVPDEGVLARIKELGAPIEALKAKVISSAAEAIDGSRDSCRARECAMGNLVADASLERVRDQGIQIAIQNGGGLRASIDSGEITMEEVLTVLPFQNSLATFQLSGKDIVASLESGVSQVEEGKGRFPQVSGLRYGFDPTVAPNEGRIKSVEILDGENWKPINPDSIYGVATNNYIRAGGDGYDLFASNSLNAYDYGPSLEDVVAEYLAANNPYMPYLDGRVTDLSVTKAAPMAKDSMAAGKVEKPATILTPELPKSSMTLATEAPKIEEPAATPTAKEDMADDKMAKKEMPKETMDGPRMHVVKSGDTFWTIAEAYYGNPEMWQKIRDANPQYRSRRLFVGANLKIPAIN